MPSLLYFIRTKKGEHPTPLSLCFFGHTPIQRSYYRSLPAHHAVLDDVIGERAPLCATPLVSLDNLQGLGIDLLAPLAPLGTLGVKVEAFAGLASEQALVHLG